MRLPRDKKGFTLIELMIVVVIIGILAALAIPRFTQTARSSRNAEALPVLKQICTLANAQKETGTTPADINAITMYTAPAAGYFTYTYAPETATATPVDATVTDAQTLDCTTI